MMARPEVIETVFTRGSISGVILSREDSEGSPTDMR